MAEKHGTWLALAATVPFRRLSCGYVGQSGGWTDLDENLQMDWEFDQAPDGNIALTGELVFCKNWTTWQDDPMKLLFPLDICNVDGLRRFV
jgi:hypothetical protein